MAYTKQNFTDGQVLTAAQLNSMDTQIIELVNKEKKLKHIEFEIANQSDTELISWSYHYDDGSYDTETDTSASDKLEILANNVLKLIQSGGSMNLTIRGVDAYILNGYATYGFGFKLFSRIYSDGESSAFEEYILTMNTSTSEVEVIRKVV